MARAWVYVSVSGTFSLEIYYVWLAVSFVSIIGGVIGVIVSFIEELVCEFVSFVGGVTAGIVSLIGRAVGVVVSFVEILDSGNVSFVEGVVCGFVSFVGMVITVIVSFVKIVPLVSEVVLSTSIVVLAVDSVTFAAGIVLFVLLGNVLFGLETFVPFWFYVDLLFLLLGSVRFLITTGNLFEVLLVIGLLKNPKLCLLKLDLNFYCIPSDIYKVL